MANVFFIFLFVHHLMPLEALDMTDLVIIIRAVYFCFAFWIWWRDRPLGGPPPFKQGIGCNAVHLCMFTPPYHLKCCGNDVWLGVTHYPVGLYFSGGFSVDLFSVPVFWYVTFFVKLKGWPPTQKSFGKSLFPLGELDNRLQIKNKKTHCWSWLEKQRTPLINVFRGDPSFVSISINHSPFSRFCNQFWVSTVQALPLSSPKSLLSPQFALQVTFQSTSRWEIQKLTFTQRILIEE